MTDATVIEILRNSLMTIMIVAAPLLGTGMLVGLIVAIFQTTTSIQEQTLTFVPKVIAIFGALMVFAAWMIRTLKSYTFDLWSMIEKM